MAIMENELQTIAKRLEQMKQKAERVEDKQEHNESRIFYVDVKQENNKWETRKLLEEIGEIKNG